MWSALLKTLTGLNKTSRWRKLVKCKRLIKQVQFRIAIQKKRREAIIRQSRSDIAQFLQDAKFHRTVAMVEQLYKDQSLLLVYDQINQFCECILANMPNVSRQRYFDLLPDNVREALSSLIFAASRCGELLELHSLRNFFRECYGSELETLSVKLLPGNMVNSEISQNLCMKHVTDEAKLLLIQEIGKEFTLYLEFQDFEQQSNSQRNECKEWVENQDYFCDIDGKWKECSEIQRSTRGSKRHLREHGDLQKNPSVLDFRSSVDSNRRKKTSVQWESRDLIPDRISVSSMLRAEMNYVYLDEVVEKSSKQERRNRKDVPQIFVDKGSTAREPDSRENSPCFNHVHPKLPEYESVVAKLMGIKREAKKLAV